MISRDVNASDSSTAGAGTGVPTSHGSDLIKIMFYGTYPNRATGYSKVANVVTNYLACQRRVKLYYMGISNFPDGNTVGRFVHPDVVLIDAVKTSASLVAGKTGDQFGIDIIDRVMEHVRPDIFVMYNDCIVTCRLLNALVSYRARHPSATKFVSYLDLVYPFQKLRFIKFIGENVGRIFVFSPFWKQNLVDMGVDHAMISVFPHGVDGSVVYRIEEASARRRMGFEHDDFVVLNANRNSYRKAHDITVRSFLMFLKTTNMDPRVKLFTNFNSSDNMDYNLEELLATECTRLRLPYEQVVNRHVFSFAAACRGLVSDEAMNCLYNACDVGLNTCLGEGFGLCNVEHGCVDRFQIVSKVGAFHDVFRGHEAMLVQPATSVGVPNLQDGHNGDAHVCRAEDFADRLRKVYEDRDAHRAMAREAGRDLRSRYRWREHLERFYSDLTAPDPQ